jgi:hypothetical protein
MIGNRYLKSGFLPDFFVANRIVAEKKRNTYRNSFIGHHVIKVCPSTQIGERTKESEFRNLDIRILESSNFQIRNLSIFLAGTSYA